MRVIVYSRESCQWCQKTKVFLNKHKIAFDEKNVEKNPKYAKESVKKSGQRGVPVIDVDGSIIIGFDEPALKKALKVK
jgi:glutaredoxin 3